MLSITKLDCLAKERHKLCDQKKRDGLVKVEWVSYLEYLVWLSSLEFTGELGCGLDFLDIPQTDTTLCPCKNQ